MVFPPTIGEKTVAKLRLTKKTCCETTFYEKNLLRNYVSRKKPAAKLRFTKKKLLRNYVSRKKPAAKLRFTKKTCCSSFQNHHEIWCFRHCGLLWSPVASCGLLWPAVALFWPLVALFWPQEGQNDQTAGLL